MIRWLVVLLLVIYVASSQDIQKVDIYESNENKTGQTLDVIATDRIKLYFTPSGNNFSYKYLTGDSNYLNCRLGKISYPTCDLTTVIPVNREEINQRPDKQWSVGSTIGDLSVNGSGAAVYNIPLTLIPGTNGVTPKISLMYNSNSGNGVAGWGWNLSGLASISRIGKDKYHDGVFEKIQFNNLDKLTLEGNRLVVVSGTEGTNNAVFATEVGNSMRIYPNRLRTNGYTSFHAKDKDGSDIEFGVTPDSRFETNKGVMSWFINKVTDANGNYILYKYGKNSGETFIQSISYTGNSDGGLAPYANIEFIYEKRTDNNSVYLNGIEINQSVILKEIQVKYNNQIVHKYVLDYINDIGYNQLYRIIEYGEDNQRFNSTIFEYYAQDDTERKTALSLPAYSTLPEFEGVYGEDIAAFFGDFNGDKISDRIIVDCSGGPNCYNISKWYMQFGKYYGLEEAGDFIQNTEYLRENDYYYTDPPNGRPQFNTEGRGICENRLLLNQVQVVDINGDGFDDVITPWLEDHYNDFGDYYGPPPDAERYHRLKIRIDTSDGSKLSFATEFTAIQERLFEESPGLCSNSVNYIICNEELLVGDYDGDGYIELMIHARQFDMWTRSFWDLSCSCCEIYNDEEHYNNLYYIDLSSVSNNGKGFIKNNITSSMIFQSREDDEYDEVNAQAIPINYNGNRNTDLMFISDNGNDEGYYEYNSSNNNLVKLNNNKMNEFEANYYYFPGDFNGDGLTDLMYFKHTNGDVWRIRYGLDGNFSNEYSIPNFNFGKPNDPYESFKNIPFVLDFNGDGKSDILWYTFDSSPYLMHYYFFISYGFQKFNTAHYQFNDYYWKLNQLWMYDENNIFMRRTPFIDINGDGNFDFFNPGNPNNTYEKNILTFNFKDNSLHLNHVYDGFNNKTSITYEPLSKGTDINGYANPYRKGFSAAYPVRDIGGGGYVVTSLHSFAANDFNTPLSEVNYNYEDGIMHLEGKGFLGFKKIIQTIPELDGQGETEIYSVNILNTDKYIFLYSTNKVSTDGFTTSQTLISNSIYNLPNSRYFVYQNCIEKNEDLFNSIRSKTDYTVDQWNNILTITEIQGSSSEPRSTTTISNEYGNINPNISWCSNNKLIKTTISKDHADDNNPVYTRKIEYSYYGSDNRFRLQKTTLDPDKTGKIELTYNYNTFGNVLKTTAKQFADANLQDRFTNFVYDPLGRFLTVRSNALGHREAFNYNPLNGNLLDYTDIAGNKIEYQYDGFGRQTKEIIPVLNNAFTDFNKRWSNANDPDGTCFVHEVSGTNKPTSKIFYNSLSRDIFSQQTSFFPDKTLRIKKEFRFDGRIATVTQPYNISVYPLNNPPKYMQYYYDSYKRPNKITDVNQTSGINLITTYGYDDNEYVQTPDGGISQTQYDLAGFPIINEDPAGNTVKYFYNNNGQVDEIKTVGLDNQDALTVSIEYDEYGNQHKLIDKDAGIQTYDYNAFGDLIKHTNPKGYLSYDYDILGRLTKKKVYDNSTSNTNEYIYQYFTSGSSIGQIKSITSSENINKYFIYDNLGRIFRTIDNIQGKAFVFEYTYNSNGLPESMKYPNGIIVKNDYNSNGYFQKQLRTDINPSGVPIVEITGLDESERINEYKLTNGLLTTKYNFDSQDYLTKIKTYKTSNVNDRIQELDYDYWRNADQNGLLKKRTDVLNNQFEVFSYDNLYRLEHYTTTNNLSQSSTIDMTYYKDGSIKSKTSTGTYYYNSDPDHRGDIEEPAHAIKGLSPVSSAQPNQSMTYTPFNSIKTIEEGSKKSEFFYGGDEQRKKNQYKVNNVLQYTKFYLDDYELITYPDQTSKEIAYLEGGCIIVKQRDNQVKTYFAHTDNLGSLQSITDENGNQLSGAEFSFDPWGNLRHKDNWLLKYGNESQQSAFEITGRGFTGHEHMTEFGLINMNGRVYDQQLGQFIQPDNFIQYPGFSQSYNRYSYCINNPLAFTDPSGELFGIDDAILIAGLVYAAGSIGYNTWLNWNNYGREAGLNTLTYSIAFTIGGYIVGAALGELIPYLINSAYSGQGLNFANPLRPDAGAGVGQSASNLTKLVFSAETRSAITQSSIGIGGAYGTFYSNRSSQDNLRSPTIDPNISPKTNVSTSNSNGFDWFNFASEEAINYIPGLRFCVVAGNLWNQGEYGWALGWWGIGLVEGLTLGIGTKVATGMKVGKLAFNSIEKGIIEEGVEVGTKVGNVLSRGTTGASGRIYAESKKEFKSLVLQLSKPGSQLSKTELKQFEKLTEKFGGKLRYDLNPVKGKILKPHVQVEGLGSKLESRHIWLDE